MVATLLNAYSGCRYPDYYQMIARPVSLRCIKNRMEKQYHSIQLFQVGSIALSVVLAHARTLGDRSVAIVRADGAWNCMARHFIIIGTQTDMMTLFDNARTYNEVGSWVYNDAEAMQKEYEPGIAALNL